MMVIALTRLTVWNSVLESLLKKEVQSSAKWQITYLWMHSLTEAGGQLNSPLPAKSNFLRAAVVHIKTFQLTWICFSLLLAAPILAMDTQHKWLGRATEVTGSNGALFWETASLGLTSLNQEKNDWRISAVSHAWEQDYVVTEVHLLHELLLRTFINVVPLAHGAKVWEVRHCVEGEIIDCWRASAQHCCWHSNISRNCDALCRIEIVQSKNSNLYLN